MLSVLFCILHSSLRHKVWVQVNIIEIQIIFFGVFKFNFQFSGGSSSSCSFFAWQQQQGTHPSPNTLFQYVTDVVITLVHWSTHHYESMEFIAAGKNHFSDEIY